jgi:hypothetical protein
MRNARKGEPMPASPEAQLDAFIDKYEPAIAAHGRAALAKMRALMPGAYEKVYDNYNALVVGFGTTPRPSEFICSIALYPKWVTLFFAYGIDLPDPTKRLAGDGVRVRSVRLASAATLDEPDVRALIVAAIAGSATPLDRASPNRLVIRAIADKQRPRRPAR